MNKKIIILSAVSLIVFTLCSYSNAYDNEIIHPVITKESVEESNLNVYLIDNLGIADGFGEFVNGKKIMEWLQDGSKAEDEPMCRASNRFHNPLLPWDESFMSDDTSPLGFSIRIYCNLCGWSYNDRKSAVTWATGYLSPNGPKDTFSTDPDYAPINWDKAREYYNSALTSTSKADRETYFGKTFEALGHVLHILQDVSVPAHVRNDFTSHLTFTGIESINPIKWLGNPFEHYVKKHSSIVTVADSVSPSFTDVRLTDFWDTDQYTGSNPSTSLSLGLNIGDVVDKVE